MANEKIEVYDSSTSSKVFTFGENGWNIYDKIEGLGDISQNVTTVPSASGCGVIVTATNIPARYVTVKAVNVLTTDRALIRNNILSNLQVGSKYYTLKISYMGKTRELRKCLLVSYDVPAQNVNNFITATFKFMATDPCFYSDTDKELFFNGSSYSGDVVNEGSAPALPVITISGAITEKYILQISDKYQVKCLPRTDVTVNKMTFDFYNMIFDPLSEMSFSTDANRIALFQGPVSLKQNTSGISVSVSFKERFWGI